MKATPPCTGETALFFPNKAHPGIYDKPKEICLSCPSLGPCGDHALSFGEPAGVWGGMSPVDRATILGSSRIRGRSRVHGLQAVDFLAEVA